MTRPSNRGRGRPRAYDPNTALQQARTVFWRHGYAATSMDELAAGMGMNRPSIYAGFGDKRALYRAAAAEYARFSRDTLKAALAQSDSLRTSLAGFYRAARDFYLAGERRGCFLIGTAVTESHGDREVREIVGSTFEDFTATFADRFERAADTGELGPHPPQVLARIATAALNDLAVRARTGATPETLDALIDAALEVICPVPR